MFEKKISFDKNGNPRIVYPLEEALDSIKDYFHNTEKTIEKLQSENEKLKNNVYKDEEITKLKIENDDLWESIHNSIHSGFPINKEEMNRINNWRDSHNKTCNCRGDVSGYRFTYSFCSGGLGTIGSIKCICGEEFVFREIE